MSEEHAKHGEQHAEGHSGGGHGGGGHGGGGHGGGGHEEAHEGAPEWLISFADNVALMMGFFVILLAMNMGPKGSPVQGGAPSEVENNDAQADRQMDFVIGVRAAFNNPISESNPADAALVKRQKQRDVIGETRQPGPAGDKKDLQAIDTGTLVNITASVGFPEGLSDLSDEAKKVLEEASENLRGMKWVIEVRGHASSVEAGRDKRRAMQLAYARGLAAAEELVAHGLVWENLRVVSCADNERATPLAQSKSGHQNNQRAEIVISQEPVAADPYRGAAGAVENEKH